MSVPADPLGAERDRAGTGQPIPQLYIACPLTGLDTDPKRMEEMSHRVETVRSTIDDITVSNRIDTEQWPVRLHIPYDKSRPGVHDNLMPTTVYGNNLDALLSSDGLIIVTDEYCSAGVGQEFEWAVRAAIPVLYLSRVAASRQIRGTPHNADSRVARDAAAVGIHVRQWLESNRLQIQSGPDRRADRELAYLGLTARLEVAWQQTTDPTTLAAHLHLHPAAIDSMISSPSRVALTPWWTICELAMLLGVPLEARRGLTFAESRAWVIAATDGGWDTRTAERMRTMATTSGAADLELPASWTELYVRRFA